MPRQSRIDAPGALHHIIARGIERKAIFIDDLDYDHFLDRLGNLLIESGISCFAWAFMPNHVHLLLKTGTVSITDLMRRLLTGYAISFNKRHKRHGHLFQNRYKSFLCEEELYLLELVRYIHLNPLRAGLVSNLDELGHYSASGHTVLMGRLQFEWQDTEAVLSRFGRNDDAARIAYQDFVADGIAKGRRPELIGGGLIRSVGGWSALKDFRQTNTRIVSDERILGSTHFTESVLNKVEESYEKKTAALRAGVTIDLVINTVAEHLGLEAESICKQGRKRSIALARAVICALSTDRLMMAGTDIAQKLNLSPSGVSRLIHRGRRESLFDKIDSVLFKKT